MYNNPAKRLLDIVEETLKIENKSITLMDAYCDILNVPSRNITDLYKRIIEIDKLIEEIENAINDNNILDPELHLNPIKSIRYIFFYSNFTVALSQVIPRLSNENIMSLKHTVSVLSNYYKNDEKKLEEKEILEFLKELNELVTNVTKSNINRELKSFIVEQLEIIRDALLSYKINGNVGLQKSLERTIYAVFSNYKNIEENIDDENVSKFKDMFQKFINMGKKVGIAIAIFNTTITGHENFEKIKDAVKLALTSGSN